MKKYYLFFVFSLLSLLFLSPLNTYAYVDSSWHTPWNSSAHTQYTEFRGYYGSWSPTVTGTTSSSASVYFNNITWTAGRNDYIELPVLFYIQAMSVDGSADEEIIDYSTGTVTGQYYYVYENGLGVNFYAYSTYDGGGTNTTATLCTMFPNTSGDSKILSGIIRCNMNSIANGLTEIKAIFTWDGRTSAAQYRAFYGTSGWVNYIPHDSDVNVNSIVSAQNQTTNAINDVNDSINDVNDSINDSTTSGANSKGTSFFGNFGNHDNAHLTTIITAPLRLFSAMQTECTQPIQIPVGFNNSTNGAIPTRNIPIPCYANFWNREDVQSFRVFWNLLIGGPCIYGLLVLLMKAYNNALDPLNDALISLELSVDAPTQDEINDSYLHSLKGRVNNRGGKS